LSKYKTLNSLNFVLWTFWACAQHTGNILLQAKTPVSGRKDQNTTIGLSSFYAGSSFLKKPETILDNIYCEQCHISLPVYPPMTYICSVIFVNENENENYQKRKNNDFVNEN